MDDEKYALFQKSQQALQQDFQDFRNFYGTDKLRTLGEQLDDIKKTARWTAYTQIVVSAITPLLTAFIAFATYQATSHNEQEKSRVERNKLAADLYTKALADGKPAVLLNTAALTRTLLPEDPTFADALNKVLTDLAQRQSQAQPIAVAANPAHPATVDSAARRKQKTTFIQIQENARLTTQAVGPDAKAIASQAQATLTSAQSKSDQLAQKGFQAVLNGQAATAQNYFAQADLAYPSNGSYYQLSRDLHKYRYANGGAGRPLTHLNNSQRQQLAADILRKYNGEIPQQAQTDLLSYTQPAAVPKVIEPASATTAMDASAHK